MKRSPLTPATTVSVTTSSHIPPPPFGSGIPGQPGSGAPTSVPHGANIHMLQSQGPHMPVKRHHLKNWTEAEPNRLVARSKGKTANKAINTGKDEARPSGTSASSGPTAKAGSYSTLGRSSAALNVSNMSASQRKISAVSSCASGADADTERDTSIDESDEVGETSEALTIADCINVGIRSGNVSGGARSCEVGLRKVSPSSKSTKTGSEPGRKSPASARTASASTAPPESLSAESRYAAGSGVKASTSTVVTPTPHSVQGYDGGNVGVLGGGVKLGGGAATSSNNNGSPNAGSRVVSGQYPTGRSSGPTRSVSGSSAFGTTASESETTIGSGTEGGKMSLGPGAKKRRSRPQQSRSPDILQARNRDPLPTQHVPAHRWSPMNPSRMHLAPTSGAVPAPMGMTMLGGGIAGQPGSGGFPMASGAPTAYHQMYAGGNQGWAQMPIGGLGMPMSSPDTQSASTPGAGTIAASGVKNFTPASTHAEGGSRVPYNGPHFPIFHPQSRTAEAPVIGQRHSST